VGFAWPPYLCNGVRNHDTFLSVLILHFLARKHRHLAIDHGAIATSHDRTDVLRLRIAAPKDAQTPCVPGVSSSPNWHFLAWLKNLCLVTIVNSNCVSLICPLTPYPASCPSPCLGCATASALAHTAEDDFGFVNRTCRTILLTGEKE